MKNWLVILPITVLVSAAAVNGEDDCDLDPFPGSQTGTKQNAWSYVADENKCYPFNYAGGGPVNSFVSLEECERSCKKSNPCAMKPYSKDIWDDFSGPDDIQYWTYKAKNNECVSYYGYRVGNENRFGSVKECELRCKKFDPCKIESFAGDESGAVFVELDSPYWAYKANTNECIKYKYGKPGDNEYGFETSEECEMTCKK